jgi:dynactin complex subunit
LFIRGRYEPRRDGVVPSSREDQMSSEHSELDELQASYKAAVEQWISAIRKEEALASVDHSLAELDAWEQAHLDEDEIRSSVKEAKETYEDALREKFFGF